MERRYCELRADAEGRAIEGVAVRYGDRARLPWGEERIEAGAFGDVAKVDATLTVQHDRGRPIAATQGGGLELRDGADALAFRATLPEGAAFDDVLALVKARVLRGASVEMVVSSDRMDGDLRVVRRASLRGLSVVDRPAYSQSEIAARSQQAPKPRRKRVAL